MDVKESKNKNHFSIEKNLKGGLIGAVFGLIWYIIFMYLIIKFKNTRTADILWYIHSPFGDFTDWFFRWRYRLGLGCSEDPLGGEVFFSLCFVMTGFLLGIMISLFICILRLVGVKIRKREDIG